MLGVALESSFELVERAAGVVHVQARNDRDLNVEVGLVAVVTGELTLAQHHQVLPTLFGLVERRELADGHLFERQVEDRLVDLDRRILVAQDIGAELGLTKQQLLSSRPRSRLRRPAA